MKKDAYYFSHDANARNDVKILKLRRVFGAEGYGIYWMLIETLRDQKDFCMPLESVGDLEFDYRVSREKILSVINDFDLFIIYDGLFFYSQSLIERMQPLLEKRGRAVDAANKRWLLARGEIKEDAKADANAYTKADASKVKESKVKESKEKESIYRSFDHLKLTNSDFQKLLYEGYSVAQLNECMDRIENYAKNKTYKNLYLTLRNWLKKDMERSAAPAPNSFKNSEAYKYLLTGKIP